MENENFVTTDKEILSECETFYKNLYSSNNGSQNGRADKVFFKTQDFFSRYAKHAILSRK